MNLLYEEFNILLDNGIFELEVANYVKDNLNPKFELRPYQIEALSRFFYYMERYKKRAKPTHLLFNMATGSGKTLIMAANILYLYKQGYRNFIFFVNSTSIIEKTKDNFLNSISSKYLFNEEIEIDSIKINIREVENFQTLNNNDINIVFTTIQGLHTTLNNPKENSITYEDFEDKEIVLLADEAHHINAMTKKKLSQEESFELESWEGTVNKIFNSNNENILLEFTATIDIENNPNILEKYKDKIIFKYDLKEFRKDGFSKEVNIFATDIESKDRALSALILSQYRLKVATKHKILLKPIILMKSKTIADSLSFEERFKTMIQELSVSDLQRIKKQNQEKNNIVQKAFKFFEQENIELDNLVSELKEDFKEENTISVNSKNDSEKKQLIVNSLEDEDNHIRVIFAVDKLNEGWDVLNLYDIVRLYETRDNKKTMAEAQLIGRGARYFPFEYNGMNRFKRKFDEDIENEMRILEELYYHSAQDSRYISELHKALVKTGIKPERTVKRELIIKDSFKQTDFWKYGKIWLNERRVDSHIDIFGIKDFIGKTNYSYKLKTYNSISINALEELDSSVEKSRTETKEKTFKLVSFGKNVLLKAMSKNLFYRFENLKKYFPHLKSKQEFIESKNYLAGIEVEITATKEQFEKLDNFQKLQIALDILEEIKVDITTNNYDYRGDEEFKPHDIKSLFKDRVINVAMGENGERGIAMSQTSNADLQLDLSSKDWYTHTENFGTDQEKLLVKFINNYIDELKEIYNEIYLHRNEKDFHIYSFVDGKRFEPDYILFLRRFDDPNLVTYQIFIEPKGEQLIEKDSWKEEFLLSIEDKSKLIVTYENQDFKLYGLPFYNKDIKDKEFKSEFQRVTGISV